MKTRYEIEYMVTEIAKDLAAEQELDDDFYGDCLPGEVMDLENRLERTKDQEEFNRLVDEIKLIFEQYIN